MVIIVTLQSHFYLCLLDDFLFHIYKIAISMLRFLGAFSSEERRLIKGVLINELSTCSDLALGKV